MLIDGPYIEAMTGIDELNFTGDMLSVCEAKAKELLGYLSSIEKIKTVYLLNDTQILTLEDTPTEVSKVRIKAAGQGWVDKTVDVDYYLVNNSIIFLSPEYADEIVEVTYTVGWDSDNVPELVKLFLVYLNLDLLNSMKPGTVTTTMVDSKKIGDYSIKYHFSTLDEQSNSFAVRINELVVLIKQGGLEPGVSI